MSKLDKRKRLDKKFNKLQADLEGRYASQDLELSNPLYHFTKIESFKKIIESKNLLLSRFDQMNDPDEFIFTKNIIDSILSTHPSHYKDIFSHEFERFISEIDVFSISFCADVNNEDLWKKYAENHRGIAIGVNLNYRPGQEGRYKDYWPAVCMAVRYGNSQVLNDFKEFTEIFAWLMKLISNNTALKNLQIYSLEIFTSICLDIKMKSGKVRKSIDGA